MKILLNKEVVALRKIAADKDDRRPGLENVHFTSTPAGVVAVATDGRALLRLPVNTIETGDNKAEVSISSGDMRAIDKAIKGATAASLEVIPDGDNVPAWKVVALHKDGDKTLSGKGVSDMDHPFHEYTLRELEAASVLRATFSLDLLKNMIDTLDAMGASVVTLDFSSATTPVRVTAKTATGVKTTGLIAPRREEIEEHEADNRS